MPSLNQRPEDIVPLARHFMMIFADKFGKTLTGITPGAEEALKSFHWVGNVRELKNRVERAVLLAIGKELTLNDLDFASSEGPEMEEEEEGLWMPPLSMAGVNYASLLESMERYYFETALELAKGNVSLAARLLHVSRDKFRYRKSKVLN
jgi:DNA-binding NtrC family response regulator